jgi:hypothetical protein
MIFDSSFRCFTLGGVELQCVHKFKYVGHKITYDFSDNDDINRA